MKKILASDLDGTLIPLTNDAGLLQAILDFSDVFLKEESLQLVYVTGRHFELTLEGIDEYKLPQPDIIVCDVGSSIYFKDINNGWCLDSSYSAYLSSRWVIGEARELIDLLSNINDISLQEDSRQSIFKLSYYSPINADNVLRNINKVLEENQIQAKIIFSIDEIKRCGLIDILPPDTAKNTAIDYLCEKNGVQKDDVIYAGDSGNDLSVVQAGYKSIIVGNASREVKRRAAKYSINAPERLYLSQGHSATGVIEGMKYFSVFN